MGLRALLAAGAAIVVAAFAASASATIPVPYKNCTQLHKKYPHGIGRANAHDVVKGDSKPVTNFTRNTRLYNLAIHYNKSLDRDHDGVACEQ
jgi:hypothetical protein